MLCRHIYQTTWLGSCCLPRCPCRLLLPHLLLLLLVLLVLLRLLSVPQVPAVFPASCRRIPRCLKTCRQAAVSFAKQVVYFISGKDASSCVSSVLFIKTTSVCVTNNCPPEERASSRKFGPHRDRYIHFFFLKLMFPRQQQPACV